MNEDDQQQEPGVNDEREVEFFPQSLPVSEVSHVSLQGKGSWVKLLFLLEISPDALILIDPDGCIVSVNNQAQELFGYTYSEL